ncbi:hypothetical protein A3F02_02115 [Candidatus Curtissbacteria bacterium RIFCSPHIGHO2_12_FULL_38_9b]|uniref:Phospholipid/glycerol acyltransferase domain-containing protein n=2 Tax=Candidatus Curtissiibacteriota TaxID=1752717 RepID=A0A1F5GZ19_9BACT|nr:MAG: hypothetical protein A3A48_01405 [Candidatus Curtissbacteria bacterium RIFCSPLOWO2_01_FULL_37_9]OGD97123.1 MAG: hypothetical protein A3F02_02115 [Candidatus Curtissbacteria bacterium RIFCSPHIGHO2_12_FULL_38_9b]
MVNHPRQNEINRSALRTARNLDNGTLIVLTPEATRIKSGKMEKARKETASFWHSNNQIHLFPIAVEGTEKQWPSGTLGTLKYWTGIGPIFSKARFIFGEPIRVDKLKSLVVACNDGDRHNNKQFEVDLAMRQIAILHHTYGNPFYAKGSYYDSFMENLSKLSWLFLKPEKINKNQHVSKAER